MTDLTWTCHICKEERPDNMIAVETKNRMIGPVEFQENVRYCVDKPECIEGAKTFSFVKDEENE